MVKTERLYITEFTLDMVEAIHRNSLDEDNRKFNPNEVFETIEDAQDTVEFLMSVYENGEGPLAYPILLTDGENIGYVQAVPMDEGKWEVGYHIAKAYTGNGYATEAVKAFLPIIMKKLNIKEIGIIVATIVLLFIIKEFLPYQYTAVNISSLVLLPYIMKGDFKATVIVFVSMNLLQTITGEIRNITAMIADYNFATLMILTIDYYILSVLLYFYFNYKEKK